MCVFVVFCTNLISLLLKYMLNVKDVLVWLNNDEYINKIRSKLGLCLYAALSGDESGTILNFSWNFLVFIRIISILLKFYLIRFWFDSLLRIEINKRRHSSFERRQSYTFRKKKNYENEVDGRNNYYETCPVKYSQRKSEWLECGLCGCFLLYFLGWKLIYHKSK